MSTRGHGVPQCKLQCSKTRGVCETCERGNISSRLNSRLVVDPGGARSYLPSPLLTSCCASRWRCPS